MAKKQPADSVIYDTDHLPPGFVPLGRFCGDSGATREYGYLDRAFQRGEFKHGRFKCRGKLYAHQDDIERCLSEIGERSACDSQKPMVAEMDAALSMAEMRLTLGRIELILERLAVAAETLATQPHEPAGSWRDMNGEVMN
jgi:hypothetical protein